MDSLGRKITANPQCLEGRECVCVWAGGGSPHLGKSPGCPEPWLGGYGTAT